MASSIVMKESILVKEEGFVVSIDNNGSNDYKRSRDEAGELVKFRIVRGLRETETNTRLNKLIVLDFNSISWLTFQINT